MPLVEKRSVFSVARAQREFMEKAPGIVYEKNKTPARESVTVDGARERERAAVKELRTSRQLIRDESITVATRRGSCKSRPGSGRGDGRGRRFVPWCSRKG